MPSRNDPGPDAPRDDTGSTVALTVMIPFMRLLEEAGPDASARARERGEPLFERWGIDPRALGDDATVRLPYALVLELQELFVDVLGDPSAPLRAGQRLQRGDYELLEYLCASCNTLGESIACLGRYYPLLIDAEHWLVVEGERAEARFRIRQELAAPDAFHEFALASNFTMSILHLELEGAQMPLEVCFAHAAPSYAALFPQVFLAPVRFECGYNALVFPASMLRQPMAEADPILHAALTRLADQELGALSSRSAFPGLVREAIEEELAEGASLERVASRLRLSESALRGKLRQHGTSYSTLLDDLRRQRASRALRQSRDSVSEIAYALGFKNPPAFTRAFRRWFGVTPLAYRDARRANPAARFFRNSDDD
jgi:AraC-like DNA-binding protein